MTEAKFNIVDRIGGGKGWGATIMCNGYELKLFPEQVVGLIAEFVDKFTSVSTCKGVYELSFEEADNFIGEQREPDYTIPLISAEDIEKEQKRLKDQLGMSLFSEYPAETRELDAIVDNFTHKEPGQNEDGTIGDTGRFL